MPRPRASKKYRDYTITDLKCRNLYVISKGSGAHIATGQSASHARRLVDAIIAAQSKQSNL